MEELYSCYINVEENFLSNSSVINKAISLAEEKKKKSKIKKEHENHVNEIDQEIDQLEQKLKCLDNSIFIQSVIEKLNDFSISRYLKQVTFEDVYQLSAELFKANSLLSDSEINEEINSLYLLQLDFISFLQDLSLKLFLFGTCPFSVGVQNESSSNFEYFIKSVENMETAHNAFNQLEERIFEILLKPLMQNEKIQLIFDPINTSILVEDFSNKDVIVNLLKGIQSIVVFFDRILDNLNDNSLKGKLKSHFGGVLIDLIKESIIELKIQSSNTLSKELINELTKDLSDYSVLQDIICFFNDFLKPIVKEKDNKLLSCVRQHLVSKDADKIVTFTAPHVLLGLKEDCEVKKLYFEKGFETILPAFKNMKNPFYFADSFHVHKFAFCIYNSLERTIEDYETVRLGLDLTCILLKNKISSFEKDLSQCIVLHNDYILLEHVIKQLTVSFSSCNINSTTPVTFADYLINLKDLMATPVKKKIFKKVESLRSIVKLQNWTRSFDSLSPLMGVIKELQSLREIFKGNACQRVSDETYVYIIECLFEEIVNAILQIEDITEKESFSIKENMTVFREGTSMENFDLPAFDRYDQVIQFLTVPLREIVSCCKSNSDIKGGKICLTSDELCKLIKAVFQDSKIRTDALVIIKLL